MGSSNKESKQNTVVTTPPPDAEEIQARQKNQAVQDLQLSQAGYEWSTGPNGEPVLNKRALTQEETQDQERSKQIEDMIYRKLTGQISDEDRALVEKEYSSAIDVGKSDLQAEFTRALENLNISESRGYQDIQRELSRGTEDINQAYRTDAAERGLSQGDTPILGERSKAFSRFGEEVNSASGRLGEDVNRSKMLLGQDQARNVRQLETGLQGAKAGAMLDAGSRQQLFAQALREFSAGLQQQQAINLQAMQGNSANTANALGTLRSRNYSQTGTSTTPGQGGAGVAGGALTGAASGAMMGMAAGPWGALAGGLIGGISGGLQARNR